MKKLVLKVELSDDRIKQKAMKTALSLSEVKSVSVDMKNKKLILIGDFDPIHVVSKLRKWCHTEIVSVEPAKEIPQMVPEISQTVPAVLRTSQREVPEILQTPKRVPEVLQTSKSTLQSEIIWRLVGLASSVVGLLCFALSPSFDRLIRGWNTDKSFLYGLISLIICVTVLRARRSSFLRQNVQLKPYLGFAVLMMISVYSYFYDKAVSGKPEILSLVSNAAFALLSLCLSKLIRLGFEMGMFCFFLGCFTIQLVTIDLKLILVAIIFGFPLFFMHSSSDFQSENSNQQGQDILSSSNSRPLIGSQGQHVIEIHRGSTQGI